MHENVKHKYCDFSSWQIIKFYMHACIYIVGTKCGEQTNRHTHTHDACGVS
jgi:hypothetical protein